MRNRMQPAIRRAHLLCCAIRLAEAGNYRMITREAIAHEAGVSGGLVSHYFGPSDKIPTAIIREAVRVRNLAVIAQGLIARDPIARRAPNLIRKAAIKTVL